MVKHSQNNEHNKIFLKPYTMLHLSLQKYAKVNMHMDRQMEKLYPHVNARFQGGQHTLLFDRAGTGVGSIGGCASVTTGTDGSIDNVDDA